MASGCDDQVQPMPPGILDVEHVSPILGLRNSLSWVSFQWLRLV